MKISIWIQGWIILITFISLIINLTYWILTIGGTMLLDTNTWSILLAIFTAINIWLVIFQINMLLKEE